MTKKTGLTFEQHLTLGRRLREINNEITEMYVLLVNAYPLKLNGPHVLRVRDGLSRLRSSLEDIMFREHPYKATTKVYYGPPDDSVMGVWINAAERQPPDEWPRPCVVIGLFGDYAWGARRWDSGTWRAQGQLRDEPVNDVLYWTEVYPLPDGTTPPGWPAVGSKEEEPSETELSFRRSWAEVIAGRVKPVETLWDDIEPGRPAAGDKESDQ